MIAAGAWISLVQAFVRAKKTKAPNLDVNLNPRQSPTHTTGFCLLLEKESRGMAKIALLGLVTVCLTVLCFSLLMQERLCSFSISSGSTLVQATLSCDN